MFAQIRWRIAVAYIVLILVTMAGLGVYLASTLLADELIHLAIVTVSATAVATIFAVALAFLIARATTNPLARLTATVRRIADGQAGETLFGDGRDEIAQLARAIDSMAEQLRQKVATVEEQNAEAAAILAGMGDGVVIVGEHRRVVAINRAAEAMLGTTDADAKGSSVTELIRRHEVINLLDDSQPHDGPIVAEIGPQRRQVQVVVSPIRVGEINRQLILLQDVTELRRAEAIRRDFVANVSHELRTPLASLRALVETLQGGAIDDPTAGPEFLGRMHLEVDRLNQMLEELLELARIESGRVQLSFKRLDVGAVVADAVERMRPQAERQAVSLNVHRMSVPAEALIDSDRLHQVIVNLTHNAIKFTPPGGSIFVTISRSQNQVAIEVSDTGIGVRRDDLPRLFERFYKTDRSRSSPGTGLGLAIVKHIVQAHSGQVAVSSLGEGKGTTFTVLLPAGPTIRQRGSNQTRNSMSRQLQNQLDDDIGLPTEAPGPSAADASAVTRTFA